MYYIVHVILQARILEWVAYPSSRGSSWPSNLTRVSCIAGRFFTACYQGSQLKTHVYNHGTRSIVPVEVNRDSWLDLMVGSFLYWGQLSATFSHWIFSFCLLLIIPWKLHNLSVPILVSLSFTLSFLVMTYSCSCSTSYGIIFLPAWLVALIIYNYSNFTCNFCFLFPYGPKLLPLSNNSNHLYLHCVLCYIKYIYLHSLIYFLNQSHEVLYPFDIWGK